MTRISHPSMRRAKDISASNPESFIVDDASESDFETEDVSPPEAITTPSLVEPIKPPEPVRKGLLENLIFLGSANVDVEIDGHIFKISTLTHRENNQLMKELYKFGDTADLFTLRTLTLAFALKSVDGVPLDEIQSAETYETTFDKRLAILDSMQMSIVSKLYAAYDKLTSSEKSVSGTEIKN